MLEFPKIDKRNVNSLCVIISSYIATVWFNRKNDENLIYIFKAKIIKDQRLNMKILDIKALRIFSDNYCNLNREIINRL